MKKYKETSNKLMQGIILGVGTAVLTGAMTAAIAAVLIERKVLPEASGFYGAYIGLLVASVVGCCLAGVKSGEQKWLAALATNGIYFVILMVGGLLVSGGHLTGVLVTALLIAGTGAGSAFMLNRGKKRGYRPAKRHRFG